MIRNLLFDLGGVIMDIRRQDCVDAFERLGLKNADSYFGLYGQEGTFGEIESGAIDVNEFHRRLHTLLRPDVTDSQIDDAFNRFLIGIPAHRLASLRELRQRGFRIYLLSNTNPIMWNSRIKEEFTKEGPTREDYFDGMVVSFEAGSLKPDASIFRHTESTLGIIPGETLFFDDSQANADAARALGFEAVCVVPGTEFTDYIKDLK